MKLIVPVLSLAALLSGCGHAPDPRIAALETQNAELKEQLSSLSNQVYSMSVDQAAMVVRLQTNSADITHLANVQLEMMQDWASREAGH